MSVILGESSNLSAWIRKEIELGDPVKVGARGRAVKRIQEWLNLHNYGLAIDGDFGPVTRKKVTQFQEDRGLATTGIVKEPTFNELVSPLLQVLEPITTVNNFPSLVLKLAHIHLEQHPREVGGQNCGPWVRLYMKGNEGPQWPWCAGFVSFVLKQASQTLQQNTPIEGSFSCDSLVAQAKSAELLVTESELDQGRTNTEDLPVASIFLVRRTSTDWTHTGFVIEFDQETFDTIEGNTNDEGSREGYEVCARSRGYGKKDFIIL